jgi:hypothetical protein
MLSVFRPVLVATFVRSKWPTRFGAAADVPLNLHLRHQRGGRFSIHEAKKHGPTPTMQVGEVAGGEQQGGVGQHIGADDPLDAVKLA